LKLKEREILLKDGDGRETPIKSVTQSRSRELASIEKEERMKGVPRIKITEDVYCYNLDEGHKCMAFNNMDCSIDCPARVGSLRQLLKLYREMAYYLPSGEATYYWRRIDQINRIILREQDKQIKAAYNDSLHRGSRGGSSESDSNNRASIKQKMKDNRPTECKWNSEEREQIKTLTEEFEAEHGKLPRLSRSPLSRTPKKKPSEETKE
jgi:hypothetical protein